MATNLAVKALLNWVNSLKLCDAEITIDELQDGVIFLKLVYMIKKEPNTCLNDSTEDRFRAVAEFIEGECRFSPTKGTSICWENIRDGINLTVEIAKVLLLLVYHDMMNDRCTLNMLDCDVERELAHLSGSFVLESEGHVYLSSGLDAYLRRKYLPVSQEIFARSATMSTSNTSTVSSLSDDESPIFHRENTIKFVDVETVASSSVSSSPLGDVMNTPKFQLKKMQREIIKERDYRDSLEKELASKIALIAQRESQMSQLKYRLDKLQEEQDDQEHVAREQINELQIKNNTLQRRLEEMLMQNKDLKNNASLMERKVDKLTEENGLLSSQVRAACSQLAILETEVGRLTEDHASAQEEWRKETSHLRSELDQATAQKELLSEQIEILQGKISSLEDEIRRATKEDVGENLGAVMEMAQLRTEVSTRCKHFEVLEEEVSRLRLEIQNKNTEVEKMRFDYCKESKALQNKVPKNQLHDTRDSLTKTEEKIQTQLIMLTKQEQESADQKELLHQLSASEEEMTMENEVQVKEEQMVLLKTDSSEQHQEIQSLKKQVETLVSSLRKAEEDMQSKEDLLSQEKQVNALQQEALQSLEEKAKQVEILQKQISAHEKEIQKLKDFQSEKGRLLFEAEEKLKTLQTELSVVKTLIAEKDQTVNALREEVTAQAKLLQKTKDEAEASEKRVVEIKEEASKHTHILNHVIQNLRNSFHLLFQKLLAKEQKLLETQQECAQQINLLQQQLASANADLNQHKERQAANLKVKECVQELQVTTLKEKEVLVQEKEALLARILQAEKDHEALQEQVEALVSQKERLVQANQATEREYVALRKLESVLQQELEILKMDNGKLLKAKEEIELMKRDLQEQLAAKSEAGQHYKAQMEKAVSHYNSKKLLLQKSQEEVDALKGSLEVKEREMQAIIMEKRLLQLDLDKAQSSEKMLSNRVASLEAQLALDGQTSKVQNKTQSNGGSATGWCFFEVPNTNSGVCPRAQEKRAMSTDSLDQSSLEDSLNSKRACTEDKMEADSTQNNPTSSAKRCRTTQKSSDCSEGDEPFYSLASARSQPNPSCASSAPPMCTELFDTPAKSCASDQLIGLPGYRHSAVYAQPISTFSVGAENEPDSAPEDWLRIAELQTRNKACLPHLKSSYPLETETGRNGPFIFTDEELRTGDPSDTIRRAATVPGQLQVSHQHSLMLGQTGAAAGTRSHHLSLLPGQLPSKTVNSHQQRSLKSTKQSSSMLCVQQTSHEKTTKPSCLPRPLTPKNNNPSSGPSSITLHPALSPAEWRHSVMFMVENTPKSNNGLKKRLSKLRGSTRKSPRSSLKKSPAQTGTHKSEEKMPSGSSRGVGQAGNVGSYKSPQVATKIVKKFPQATSRSGKFPGLTR